MGSCTFEVAAPTHWCMSARNIMARILHICPLHQAVFRPPLQHLLVATAKTCRVLDVLQGNGIIVGLGICGVIFAATSSAATLMGDFRTGYMCLTAPRAMFVAQLVGQLIGALLAPVAFLLFWGTGQVNVPNGPYPGDQPTDTDYHNHALCWYGITFGHFWKHADTSHTCTSKLVQHFVPACTC